MKKSVGALVGAVLMSYLAASAAHAVSIDFEDGAARGLSDNDAADSAWSDLGVVFNTMNWRESCTSTSSACLSGMQFPSETSMLFSPRVTSADFLFGGTTTSVNMTVTASLNGSFVGDQMLGTPAIVSPQVISLSGIGDFDKLTFTGSPGLWQLDNLNFTPVPSPATLPLLGWALGLLGLASRRRRRMRPI